MSNERYQGNFFEYFGDLKDARQEGKVYHRLTDILFIVVSGILCGYENGTILIHGRMNLQVMQYIALANGMPSLSTLKRSFSLNVYF